jgi:hypothetical protein
MNLMLHHPPVEAGENLCVMYKACIHALEGARVPHNHVGMIEFIFYSKCTFCVLHQLLSLGGGGLGTETPPRVSWGQW